MEKCKKCGNELGYSELLMKKNEGDKWKGLCVDCYIAEAPKDSHLKYCDVNS